MALTQIYKLYDIGSLANNVHIKCKNIIFLFLVFLFSGRVVDLTTELAFRRKLIYFYRIEVHSETNKILRLGPIPRIRAAPHEEFFSRGSRLYNLVNRQRTRPDEQTDRRTDGRIAVCLLYTSPSPRDRTRSRMPSSA